MMETNVIAVDRAAAAYKAMRADGSRLPWNEVNAQIKEFRKIVKELEAIEVEARETDAELKAIRNKIGIDTVQGGLHG